MDEINRRIAQATRAELQKLQKEVGAEKFNELLKGSNSFTVKLCGRCFKPRTSKYCWTVSIKYAGQGGLFNGNLCTDCIHTMFGISKEKIEFLELLVEFRKKHKLPPHWHGEKWSKALIDDLLHLCDLREIPIKDYGIALYTLEEGKSFYLHEFKKRKRKSKKQTTKEFYDDIEKEMSEVQSEKS